MNRFKLNAYIQEFPFLRNIIGDSIPDSVRVKRADENLFNYIPRDSSHVGSLGRTELETKVHFVLKDGTILQEAVIPEKSYSSNYRGDTPFEKEGETVLEAIDRHGVADTLQYIVVEKYYFDSWEGREREEEYAVTLYKTPKGTTFEAEIEKAKARALSEVRAEADF